ncbi:hypothetical protein [Chitinimonas sp. BJB300]|uniref:hypothetical protein n=1 Tax=Chitinimonas sp. BJB300 TaxID=1559339 RepID=UPI000C117A03|nr:hypothetical protein [Chitinimonas sp. BJB300]PHV10632.1 hypothetical protein CSQ89_15110 [Chitinimonas sp. BJB300]TSJ83795.1 hypothetical protein FG002_020825 [Chitinimonas sp. BJB300]
MKIQQSQVQLAGQHSAARELNIQEKVRIEARPAPPRETVALSAEALAAQQHDSLLNLRTQLLNHPLWKLIQELIKKLTGREIDIDEIIPVGDQITAISSPPAASLPAQTVPPAITWQIDYQYREERRETEASHFQANGEVISEDGRQFKFSTAINLYREFSETTEIRFNTDKPTVKQDPLVLNYNAQSATLTQNKFKFDLNIDGTQDDISFVAEGSGFLAFDKSGDGKINDGQELFGAQSGNGFTDLARYDNDGNGWIDEADSVWGKLSLWIRDATGKDKLLNLADLGIGALHLGYTDTDFSLRDEANQEHGQIRRSSIYLSENGQVGTLQQVDLVT